MSEQDGFIMKLFYVTERVTVYYKQSLLDKKLEHLAVSFYLLFAIFNGCLLQKYNPVHIHP